VQLCSPAFPQLKKSKLLDEDAFANLSLIMAKVFAALAVPKSYFWIGAAFLMFDSAWSEYSGEQVLHADGGFERWHDNSIVVIIPVELAMDRWRIVPTRIVEDLPFKWSIQPLRSQEEAWLLYGTRLDRKKFFCAPPVTSVRSLAITPHNPGVFVSRIIHQAGPVEKEKLKANLFCYLSPNPRSIDDLDETTPATSFLTELNLEFAKECEVEIDAWLKVVKTVSTYTRGSVLDYTAFLQKKESKAHQLKRTNAKINNNTNANANTNAKNNTNDNI
jgi:hypothetical protein